jgi:hypothetical protein
VTVLSILGLTVGLAALLLSAFIWVDKKRSERDQEATDELMMNYMLLLAGGQGFRVDAGMMKRYVPGFRDESPIPVDVVNLIEIITDTERHGRNATVDEVRASAPHGLGPIEPSPEGAIHEAVSRGLVQKKGKAFKLTRKGRILNKAMRYLDSPFFPQRIANGERSHQGSSL